MADVHRMTSLMGSKYKMMKADGCTKSRIDSYDWITLVIDLVDLEYLYVIRTYCKLKQSSMHYDIELFKSSKTAKSLQWLTD